MEFSSEAGRFILSPNSEGNSSVRTCTQTHSCCIPAQKHTLKAKRGPTKTLHKNVCIFPHIHARVLSFPLVLTALSLLVFLQHFPAHAVYLSCYIQSMNIQSQQVWTQLLNIQPCAASCSSLSLTISVLSHLKLS